MSSDKSSDNSSDKSIFLFCKNLKKYFPLDTCTSPSAAWFADPETPPEAHWEKLESYTLKVMRRVRVCAKCRSFRCETVLPNLTLARLTNRGFVDSAVKFARRKTPEILLRTIVRMASSPMVSSCDCAKCAEVKFQEQRRFRANKARRSVQPRSSVLPDRTIFVNRLERQTTTEEIRVWYAAKLGLLLEKLLFSGVFDVAQMQESIDETFVRLISMGCASVALPLSFFTTRALMGNTVETFLQEHDCNVFSPRPPNDRERCSIPTKNQRVLQTMCAMLAARYTDIERRHSSNHRYDLGKVLARHRVILTRSFPLAEEHASANQTQSEYERRRRRCYDLYLRESFAQFGCSRDNPCENVPNIYSKLYRYGSKLYVRALCHHVYIEDSLTDAGFLRKGETAPHTIIAESCRTRPGPRSHHERQRSRVERLRVGRYYKIVQ